MSRRWTNYAIAAGVTLALGAAPAAAQQGQGAADRDRPATGATRTDDQARESTGEKVTDAWILTKVKAQFIGEDALKDSDINVDVRDHVVYLKGTVASQAGKTRAAEIARATDGVTRVANDLRIGVAKNRTIEHDRAANDGDRAGDPTIARGTAPVAGDVRDEGRTARGEAREAGRDVADAAHDAKEHTKDAAHHSKQAAKNASAEAREESREARNDASEHAADAKHDTKQAAKKAGHETREATGTAGQAVSDGWITTKVKSSFTGVDVLDGSDINVDTNDHVVTLRGTVPSEAGRARAVSLAKRVDGVRSVKDELKIAPKK